MIELMFIVIFFLFDSIAFFCSKKFIHLPNYGLKQAGRVSYVTASEFSWPSYHFSLNNQIK